MVKILKLVVYSLMASVELGVASILTIEADIKLDNPDFSVKNWPSSIENKYTKVLNWYNHLSSSQKADFDVNYMNKPLKGYTMISQRSYNFNSAN